MALYRNIAGLNHGQQVGLSFAAPTDREVLPGTYNLDRWTQTPEEYLAEKARLSQAIYDANVAKYDWLLSQTFAQLTAAGYYVEANNGSVFLWDDAAHTTSHAYLPIQDIQQIENNRGTAGTMLLHLQEPAIAKDTAGYAGGGSFTWGGGAPSYSDPIPDVQDLPPVRTDDDGDVTFEYTGPTTILPTTVPTNTTSTPTNTNTAPVTTAKNNLGPLVALGGLVAVALAGDALTGRRTKLFFAGGVGALFYLMAKRK